MPTPDTSPRNIAFALRRAVSLSASDYNRVMNPPADRPSAIRAQCLALADALDAAPKEMWAGELSPGDVPVMGAPWHTRVLYANTAFHEARDNKADRYDAMNLALRAAFPELAPVND